MSGQSSEESRLSSEVIRSYRATQEVVDYVKSRFVRIQKPYVVKLIRKVLNLQTRIHIDELTKAPKSFYQYNMGKFDNDKYLKADFVKILRIEIVGYISDLGKELKEHEGPKLKSKNINGVEYYLVDERTMYNKVRQFLCDEGGKANFKYGFESGKLKSKPPYNSMLLQRCNIQILSIPVKFDYPVEYIYACPPN